MRRSKETSVPPKVLLVDDDSDGLKLQQFVLRREGYAVEPVCSGKQALTAALSRRPDIVVSDVQMPEMDGFELCDRLRRDPRTSGIPILLMSGQSKTETDQLKGLEGGADDYMLKPFTPRYLIAKVKALLRRYRAPEALSRILKTHGLSLDVAARTVKRDDGGLIRLTRKEFDLLTIFLERPGRVLTQRVLLESVWGYDLADYNDPHTVTVHLCSLRRKLGKALGESIVTVPGMGYRFESSGNI
ncbi:MAG: response regulator transcription factor [Elusimicrobiota bacterium]